MKPQGTDPTLTPSQVSADADTVGATKPDAPAGAMRLAPAGYELRELLGRGGMGEVVLARDTRIERDVAVKRMRGETPTAEATARFLREAKIQARLDHPAIVPVHELGTDADGRPYFTMKRLAGTTLSEVLGQDERPPLQRLLRVFVDICQAIEFAHARGVIHRDLKPANVMLGEYGEVYVLDWGVARMIGDVEHAAAADIQSLDDSRQTQAGAMLGTPGYMSPEQIRGVPVTPATDVYALGAILFEILAAQSAHPRGAAALVTTLATAPRPSERAPERTIAPELDDACAGALAQAAGDRPTAAALAERIQRYLDGDRDLEQRRALAAEELARAEAAFATGDPANRADAMRAAGRALVLDPASQGAAKLVLQAMLEPPSQLPADLAERLDRLDGDSIRRQARLSALSMLVYLLVIPMFAVSGVRSWPVAIATLGLAAVAIAGAELMHRRGLRSIAWAIVIGVILNVLLARLCSPLVLVPAVITSTAISLVVFPTLLSRPYLVIGPFIGAFFAPFVLEATGVWSSTWSIVADHFEIRSAVVDIDHMGLVILLLGHVGMLIVVPLFVRSLAIQQRAGRRQLEIQAWHLGKLLPIEAPQPQPATAPRCVI